MVYIQVKKAYGVIVPNSLHYVLKLVMMFSMIIFSVINLYAKNETATIKTKKTYSEYVKDLENNKTDIDYTDFRHSYYNTTFEKGEFELPNNKLGEESVMNYNRGDLEKAEEAALKLLASNYSSMHAHLILSLIYKQKNEEAKYEKHMSVVKGLISSITITGDGLSPETAWKVIDVFEEYFILSHVLNVEIKAQELSFTEPVCDKMTVVANGEEYALYFDISLIMQRFDATNNSK